MGKVDRIIDELLEITHLLSILKVEIDGIEPNPRYGVQRSMIIAMQMVAQRMEHQLEGLIEGENKST